jgi:ribosomal protein S18 acetylase RimI-like enzyme
MTASLYEADFFMSRMIELRPMQASDLDQVMRIQALCYSGDIPEERASLLAKLIASPSSCFVALLNEEAGEIGNIQGYLFSLPWSRSAPPALNSLTCELPQFPDCYYLHDLSVAPNARQHGVGRALVQSFLQTMQAQGFQNACLVAVQNSGNYWRRYGFQTAELNPYLQEKLASYGTGAEFLVLNSV